LVVGPNFFTVKCALVQRINYNFQIAYWKNFDLLENFVPRVSRVSAAIVGNVPVEDRLNGASNFNSWKSRLLITLEESDLMKFVEEFVPKPANASEKTRWKKNDAKARKIIIFSVKDHLIPHISPVKTTKEMFDALKKLFESKNTNRAITLKHQLQNIKMTKADIVATFFMKIVEIRDQLGAIGEIT
jgi:hypothetical protein